MGNETKFINLTPHPINYHRVAGKVVTIPSSGVLRVQRVKTPEAVCRYSGMKVVTAGGNGFERPLPPRRDGTFYIVSLEVIVELAAAGVRRPDLVYAASKIRDGDRVVVGTTMFARLAE